MANSHKHNVRVVRIAAAGAATELALTLLSGWLVWRQTLEQETSRNWVMHTLAVITAIEDVSDTVRELDVGVRDYFVKRDPLQLQVFARSQPPARAALRRLRELTRDNAGQQRKLERLDTLLQRKITLLQRTLDTMQRDPAAAMAALRSNAEQRTSSLDVTEAIAQTIRELIAEERQLLQLRQAQDRSSAERG
jgi:CHASE3 domain sensor protein